MHWMAEERVVFAAGPEIILFFAMSSPDLGPSSLIYLQPFVGPRPLFRFLMYIHIL
jgi:hypothetical protein